MTESKEWYESEGMWGGIVTIIVAIAGILGYTVSPEDQHQLVIGLTALGTAIGGIISLHGRKTATKRIR